MTELFVPVFQPWASIARLDRPIVVSEKIDGTNAAIGIHFAEDGTLVIWAQSRSKIITPGKTTDNAGFAGWVEANKETLVADLGEGLHFGEWWGAGIQRNYGMKEKHFSLFNTSRWLQPYIAGEFTTPNLRCVPLLGRADHFNRDIIDLSLEILSTDGSKAAPGFMNPEGIVVFHAHGNMMFKKTLKDDDKGKTWGA